MEETELYILIEIMNFVTIHTCTVILMLFLEEAEEDTDRLVEIVV